MAETKKTLKTCDRGHAFYKSSDCPVCPICWSGFYKDKYGQEFPGISAPALRALLNADITTVKKLSQYSEKEILTFHGMGPKSLPLLRAALKAKKLSFKE